VDVNRWREDAAPEDAGGLLFDLGPHLIDQALELLGPARSVYAEVRALRPGAEVDDDVFIALEHASGVRSQLWATMLAASAAEPPAAAPPAAALPAAPPVPLAAGIATLRVIEAARASSAQRVVVPL
jgi:hypothetical protein